MFPDLRNYSGKNNAIITDRNVSHNYDSRTQAVINWNDPLTFKSFYLYGPGVGIVPYLLSKLPAIYRRFLSVFRYFEKVRSGLQNM